MKNDQTKQIVIGWIVIAVSAGIGYWIGSSSNDDKMSRVVDWNTKQIHSLGIAASTDSYNAELMIQILNHLEGNEVKVPSRSLISEMIASDDVITDDDVPHTFEQIEKDQKEVDRSIRAFATANLFQAETLHNILNKKSQSRHSTGQCYACEFV